MSDEIKGAAETLRFAMGDYLDAVVADEDDDFTPEERLGHAVRHEYIEILKAKRTPEATRAAILLCVSDSDDPRVDDALRAALEE